MNILIYINLFCVPFSAYMAGTCETKAGKILNAAACLINLAIVAAKLSSLS